jgi:alpha-mannosidase
MKDSATQVIQRLGQRVASIERRLILAQHSLPAPHYAQLPDGRPLSAIALETLTWQPLSYHSYWGTWQTNFLMRFQLRLPADWDTTQPSLLHLPLGEAADDFQVHPEALIYADGEPFATADVRHAHVALPLHLCDGQPHELLLHGWTCSRALCCASMPISRASTDSHGMSSKSFSTRRLNFRRADS